MAKMTLEMLGRMLAKARSARGIREVAAEIGLSAATLSRVENGHVPDLVSFQKICRWLKIDPSTVLGFDAERRETPTVSVHFRKDRTLDQKTARALANMLLAAQRSLSRSTKDNV